ncbi:amino acid adenylation domain-containing protein [Streptomyces antarcticus]|uniref:amino acid adenylation domain-containing protein n=1 Tax=Streptomyces antarcticus TaxID=2996458 RepID=UPI0022705668|nr:MULTISPECIES: amino acid adenylation domain-containing protein [unclassified Streptomyces]MCY0941348.1 amino acid adenylation domain-containing protein [Streptomyces sp. H34-AA3]MCZ4084774.1 amino acid adenylation domain-containing protein [Streptomyces sp. H34-S5]
MNAVLLPELFAERVRSAPHAPAVVDVDGGVALDYLELDRASNRMAHLMRGLGAGPGTLVGIALERGPDLVVALLAVWKAPAAYVPLDPGQPPARLAGLIRDSGAALVLAEDGLAGTVRDAGARPLGPVTAREDAARMPDTAPPFTADPDRLAYAIFTSGSTGRPKAVAVTHAGIAGRVGWTVTTHGIGPADRVLLKTSLAFDAAGWEVFAPLAGGGTIVLAPPGAERDPAALLRSVARGGVTVLQAVPSVLRLLAEEGAEDAADGGEAGGWAGCGALRLLFSAGEPLYAELATRLRERTGGRVRLWNTYGPTECSIDVTAQLVDPEQRTGPVPIGRSITGMRVVVRGPAGEPVPVGVPGELYAGGPGVARGYLGRPELTAERFVPDPYGPPGARLYRTGDLVRWRADHTLDYLGRTDDQVKVNGVRVEPGETEAALAAHPAVSGAVVTPCGREGEAAHRLAAHLTLREAVTDEALRGFLADLLPDSHIPAVFRTLEAFPLTVGGKADRVALRDAEERRVDGRPPCTAPRGATEELVATVWAELLGAERIGAHDDFFALGGTSLHVARLAARLRAASGGRVPLRGLFTAATVAAQARLIGTVASDRGADTGVGADPGGGADTGGATPAVPAAFGDEPIRPVPRDGELPLSPGQRRLWFLDRLRPGRVEWVSPVLLRLPAATSSAAVRAALRELAVRHEALRTRYRAVDGEPRQLIVSPEATGTEPELRIEDTGRDGLAALFTEQFRRGFDLADGPLWRALLARTPGEDHLLLLTVHHIGCDGWSTTILERELRELCAAYEEGRAPALERPAVQYADYGAWQRGMLTEEYTRAEVGHWRGVLDGLEPLELPTDRPRPAERDARGAVVAFPVDPEVSRRLTALGRAHGATPLHDVADGLRAGRPDPCGRIQRRPAPRERRAHQSGADPFMSHRIGRLGESGAVHIWHGRVTDVPDPADIDLLDDEELRVFRARLPPLDAHYAGAHAAVRRILADDYLGGSPAAIRFGRHACARCGDPTHGRPRIMAPATRLELNLSRSGPYWVCAVTAGGQVGVDIERHARLDVEGAAEFVLSDEELAGLRATGSEREREEVFLRAWTRKEAVLKAVGVGIFADLRHVDVAPLRSGPVRVEHDEPGLSGSWVIEDVPLGPGLSAAVAQPARRPGPVVLRGIKTTEKGAVAA